MKNWQGLLVALLAVPVIGLVALRPDTPFGAARPAPSDEMRQSCARIGTLAGVHGPFADRLTAACEGAFGSVGTAGAPRETALAWAFLRRLAAYRDAVTALNAKRAAESPGSPRGQVSATGAYLIAGEIGLFDAHDAWALAAGFPLASR